MIQTHSNKSLHLSFAMGGSVSLGTFSGAALTESLKLLLISGQDEEGKPYENITLDSFSGASGGAMSLVILLRCLMDYKSMLDHPYLKTNLDEELKKYFKVGGFDNLSDQKKEALRAIQLAQEIQKQVWVRAIDFEGLTNNKTKKSYNHVKQSESFGLLDRNHLNKLTQNFIFHNINKVDLRNKQLLGDRVIFLMSMTNIYPIQSNLQNPIAKNRFHTALKDTYTNKIHKEVRIFDFNLIDEDREYSVNHWVKVGEKSDYPINSKET